MVGAHCVSIMARTTGIWDGVHKVPPRAHCMTGLGTSLNFVRGSPSGQPKILVPGPAPETKTHRSQTGLGGPTK